MRYANGAVQLIERDLGAVSFGQPWGHTRSYSNRLNGSESDMRNRNGANWFIRELPQLVTDSAGIGVVGIVQDTKWFTLSGSSYTPRFFFRGSLAKSGSGVSERFVYTEPSGRRFSFYGFDALIPSDLQGQFNSVTDPAGNTSTALYDTSSRPTGITFAGNPSSTSSGVATSCAYEYVGGTGENVNRLARATLSVNGSSTRRAEYSYYVSTDTDGDTGDLKSVSRQEWNGTAWVEYQRCHYRYYRSGATGGFAHALKYVVGPTAYANMTAAGIMPETATATQIEAYADNAFTYDSGTKAVLQEVANAGTKTFGFSYTPSGDTTLDYNRWATKTIETLPGDTGTVINQNIVYTNFAGLVMLKIHRAGPSGSPSEWYTYYRYYDNASSNPGAVELIATSAAISSYTESSPGLVTLKTGAGLIWAYDWYTSTTSTGYAGQLQRISSQVGSAGARVKLQEFQYTSQTGGSGTLPFVSKITRYQDAATGGSSPADTSFAYTWTDYQLTQIVTTWPVITDGSSGTVNQNGAGGSTGNTRTDQFDQYGNPTWSKDERGVITYQQYSNSPNGRIQRIEDVNSSMIFGCPWTTPVRAGIPASAQYGRHLITDYTLDPQGRVTQELGPTHTVDLAGTATAVRRARWWVYVDASEVRTASGYQAGASVTLVNPVLIQRTNNNLQIKDIISASRASSAGPLSSSDALEQNTWSRWSSIGYDAAGRKTYQRTYISIPTSGVGTVGTHYIEATYGYDTASRLNRIASPNGTITRTVVDFADRQKETWVGTNDTGATDSDPSNGGTGGNNMVRTEAYVYDGGADKGNGLLTQVTFYVDGSSANNRVTTYAYTSTDRIQSIGQQVAPSDTSSTLFRAYTFDNQDRLTNVSIYSGTSVTSANRVASRDMYYDNLGRLYKGIRRGVTIGTGTLTDDAHSVRDEFWRDPSGNVIKKLSRGRSSFEKFVYDGLKRAVSRYYCYGFSEYLSPTYANAGNVAIDTVLHQDEWTFDDGGNNTLLVTRERFHDASTGASGLGPLNGPSTEPLARVSYTAFYPDAVGRTFAIASFGTNGGATLSRPATAPVPSDTVLVTRTSYNAEGAAQESTDPAGRVIRTETDQAGRVIRIIENYVSGGSGSDVNQTTEYAYDAYGRLASMTAKNSVTGDQVTRFAYGTSVSGAGAGDVDDDIARNDLVRAMIYPDSDDTASPVGNGTDGTYDRVEFRYNRQGEVKQKKEPNATVHTYYYDKLGRWIHDAVTDFPTKVAGVSDGILRISRTFEGRGRISKITSYDNKTVGSGNVKNEIERVYNAYRQLSTEYQEHNGPASHTTSRSVTYGYATSGSDLFNTVRRTTVQYPITGSVTYSYGAGDSSTSAFNVSRVSAIMEGSSTTASYTYLGWERRAQVVYPEVALTFTQIRQAGEVVDDAGDQYNGWDRFGRVQQTRWMQPSTTTAQRTLYGFDRNGNRTWRNELAASPGNMQDEAYQYDGLNRLTRLQRGALNTNHTAIGGIPSFEEQFSLDPSGNWHAEGTTNTGAYVQSAGGTVQANQNRVHNRANEVTSISGSVNPWASTFTHDGDGNVTQAPLPIALGSSMTCVYDPWSRLVKVTYASSSTTNTYDGMGRRIIKAFAGKTQDFYYSDQWQLLGYFDGGLSASSRSFIWGLRYPDDLICRSTSSTSSERRYALHDYLNVTGATTPVGSAYGVAERYGYDAYGTPRVMSSSWSSTTSTLDWEFRFGASFYDSETGLCLMRYRFLHPKLGRWISRDPIGYADGFGLYQFAGNSPADTADPTGLVNTCVNGGWDPGPLKEPDADEHDYESCLKWAEYNYAKTVAACYCCCPDNTPRVSSICATDAAALVVWFRNKCEKKWKLDEEPLKAPENHQPYTDFPPC